MLTVSPLSSSTKDGGDQEEIDIASFSMAGDRIDFQEFAGPSSCFLDSIDFEDFLAGIHGGVDVLPELLPELSAGSPAPEGSTVAEKRDGFKVSAMGTLVDDEIERKKSTNGKKKKKEKEKSKKFTSLQAKDNSSNNNNQGKRKTKVDWTPDLHRRFMQAVEQLGVDKAVPSRILELMGIDSLTRHNVASHLQKYRSHRKHLLAREAEAESWSQKQQMFSVAVALPVGGGGGNGGRKGKLNHRCHGPAVGFPPPLMPPPIHHQPSRHLHVWGHPPTWAVASHHPPAPVEPSPWHSHHHHVPATSCFPHPMPTTRFPPEPPVPGVPPPPSAAICNPEHGVGSPEIARSGPTHPPLMDFHPTTESVDAAIGDVLTKPRLPLPIGLKPPSMDSVMAELQRQGVPKVLPSSCP